jgi:hypothetical protein
MPPIINNLEAINLPDVTKWLPERHPRVISKQMPDHFLPHPVINYSLLRL